MSIKLPKNLKEIPRTQDDELPIGFYLAKVYGIKYGNYQDQIGNEIDTIKITFEIIQPEEYKGYKISDMLFIKESTLWKVAMFLDSVFGRIVNVDTFPDNIHILGKEIVILVREDSSGRRMTSINRYFPITKWEIYKNIDVQPNQNIQKQYNYEREIEKMKSELIENNNNMTTSDNNNENKNIDNKNIDNDINNDDDDIPF